jgi:hypothetical protein
VEPARTYRTRRSLRVAVALAAAFWAAMAAVLAAAPGTSSAAVAGAAALSAFFTAAWVVYARSSVTVTEDGLVAASPLRRRRVPFEDVLRIVVRDGLGGRVYAVFTRRGVVQFTSLFARHRELFETLLERSDLSPEHA